MTKYQVHFEKTTCKGIKRGVRTVNGDVEPEQHMFQHSTALNADDPEIGSALKRAGKVIDKADFDVYSVYRTTTG